MILSTAQPSTQHTESKISYIFTISPHKQLGKHLFPRGVVCAPLLATTGFHNRMEHHQHGSGAVSQVKRLPQGPETGSGRTVGSRCLWFVILPIAQVTDLLRGTVAAVWCGVSVMDWVLNMLPLGQRRPLPNPLPQAGEGAVSWASVS